MRIFGSDSMNNMLEKLGLKDGESIDHPWINKALERAQQKVEARNFDVRKTLLKFDNVLNDQRHVIFTQRNNIINSKNSLSISDEFLNEIILILLDHKKKYLSNPKNSDFKNYFKQLSGKAFANEEIDSFLEMDNEQFKKNIYKKFSDQRIQRENILGKDRSDEIEKRIFLQLIDQNWTSHIQYLEQLRTVIGLRSYGQRDPLIEYKKEAFNLFENLLNKLKSDFITILLNLKVVTDENNIETKNKIKTSNPKCLYMIKKNEKISRNEKCPATGKKFKHCCGAL